jgi:hypothetical protein
MSMAIIYENFGVILDKQFSSLRNWKGVGKITYLLSASFRSLFYSYKTEMETS